MFKHSTLFLTIFSFLKYPPCACEIELIMKVLIFCHTHSPKNVEAYWHLVVQLSGKFTKWAGLTVVISVEELRHAAELSVPSVHVPGAFAGLTGGGTLPCRVVSPIAPYFPSCPEEASPVRWSACTVACSWAGGLCGLPTGRGTLYICVHTGIRFLNE